MILFYGEGRLGNQLFQYSALAALARPHEAILAIGLESLDASFVLHGPQVHALRLGLWLKRACKYLLIGCALRPLARTARLCNYGSEASPAQRPVAGGIAVRRGLWRSVTFVDGGYYQRTGTLPGTFKAQPVRPSEAIAISARTILTRHCPDDSVPVFVHVRRGDYLTHSFAGDTGGVALPTSYYRQAIDRMREAIPNAHFAFVTDDPAWVANEFSDVAARSVHSSTVAQDWALMACCRAGILSNSSLALSAALSIVEPLLILGPRYWMGFRQARWIPEGIEWVHPAVHYLDVPQAVPVGGA